MTTEAAMRLTTTRWPLMAVILLGVAADVRADLLLNGGFDIPTPGLSPPNYPTSISGPSGGGPSGPASADHCLLFNSRDPTTSTELLNSTDPSGGGFMIHLTTNSNTTDPVNSFFNGLEQGFPAQTGATTASVDVFVLSGPVLLALFANDGATLLVPFILSSTTNQWETLSITVPAVSNPNLLVIFSESTSGLGEFYADNASVTSVASVPEPSTLALATVAGLAGLGCLWRRRRRAA